MWKQLGLTFALVLAAGETCFAGFPIRYTVCRISAGNWRAFQELVLGG